MLLSARPRSMKRSRRRLISCRACTALALTSDKLDYGTYELSAPGMQDTYQTAEIAESSGLKIKKGYPIVQVSIYDSVDKSHRLVELPGAAA